MTLSGSPESKSRYASIADRGRMQAETGMAHVYGYPDPNAGNDPHSKPGRMPQSTTGTSGSGHTTGTGPGTGSPRVGEDDYHGHDGRVDGGVRREAGGHGTDDGYGQPGVQHSEHQQPAIDRNTEMGSGIDGRAGLSPARSPQNASSEAGRSPVSQAGALTRAQEKTERDPPPELPPRPQAQATDNDQHGQMYQ